MAAVIPFVVQAIAAYMGASALVATVLAAVATYGVASYTKRKAARKAREEWNKSLTDRLVMVTTADAARSFALGRVRSNDGVLFKGSYGPKRERFAFLVALAGHEIDGVEQVYFGDTPVTLGPGGLVLTEPWGFMQRVSHSLNVPITPGLPQTVDLGQVFRLGSVAVTAYTARGSIKVDLDSTAGTTVTYTCPPTAAKVIVSWQADEQKSAAVVSFYEGAPDQDVSPWLLERFPDLVTTDHKFRGIALLAVELAYNQTAFTNGVPAVTAVYRGARMEDPRTGLVAWSENPAVCSLFVARHPSMGGCYEDEVDEAGFIAAANACDVVHTYTDSAGVATTRKLYTCSYVASTAASPETHLTELVEAMAGKWGWAGGRLKVRAGVYSPPVVAINDSWLAAGTRQIIPGPTQGELVNTVTPIISDAAQKYVPTPITPVRAEPYVEADGGELPDEWTLSAVAFAPQAQHIVAVKLRELRQGMVLHWPVTMRAFLLELFDVVALTSQRFQFDGKPFEVVGWGFTLTDGIALTLHETGASVYQPDDVFPANDPEPNTSLPRTWEVSDIIGLAADSGNAQLMQQDDGSIVGRVKVSFDPIPDAGVLEGGRIEVQYSRDGEVWESAMFDGAMSAVYLQGLQESVPYLIKARAHTRLASGMWTDQIVHVVLGKRAPPSDVSDFAAVATTGGIALTWSASTDLDAGSTMLRLGATWDTSTLLADVAEPGSSYVWPWPDSGTYTVLARHIDRSGNDSETTATATITVTGQDIAITTGQLKDNAATKVLQTSLASGTTDALSTTPTVTETVKAGWVVLVHVNFFWDATKTTPGAARVRGRVWPDVSVTGGSIESVGDDTRFGFSSPDLTQNQSDTGFGAKTYQYMVTGAGTLSVFGRCSQQEVSSGTPTMAANIQALKVVVEVIKV